MAKELKFQSTVTAEQPNSEIKKRKRSEAQIEEWETIRRQSTTVEDKDLNIEGVMRLTLSVEMQRFLGCVFGEHVSPEMPWTNIKKEQLQAYLTAETEKSEIFAVKEPLMEFPGTEILVGYICSAKEPNQFYICTTEAAKKTVLEMIIKDEAEQERRVSSYIYKVCQEWNPLGSGKEVEDNQPKHARPLLEMQTWAAASHLNQPVMFQDRNVDDVQDGYVKFDPRRHKYVTVTRKRTDIAVQAVPEKCLSVAQTDTPLPSNIWTQYEFHADAQKEIEDEELSRSIKQFLHEKSPQMADLVRYNSVFDLYKVDYPDLVTAGHDVQVPKKIIYSEYQSFMDVRNCKGKVISAAAWHPMWTGVVACAYIDHMQNDGIENDVILQDVFSTNLVLIWSFMDALNPKLLLRSPRKVHALQFSPYNENLMAGGCSSGQVLVWDLCDKLKVEEDISLSDDKLKYRHALHDLMGWTRPTTRNRLVNPALISSLEFSHSSSIMDIKWLSPYYEISHLGRYQELKSNQPTSLQFLTCSEDGSVFVWDLNARGSRRPPKMKPKRRREYKFMVRQRGALSYKQMAVLKPHYKFVAESPSSKGCLPLSVIAVEAFPLRYMLQTQTGFRRKFNMTERLLYKPEFQQVKSLPKSKVYIGSMEGHVIHATWEGYEFNLGEEMNSESNNNFHYLCTKGTWAWEVLQFVHPFMLLLQSDMLAPLSCTSGMNIV
ncbi:hypothetical protein B7P43_G17753 [Cryptotermes secundus]|uniref:WD repeat-containing protein 63 n=1 Tax=Cryptotermes secundus TaxID=105785 RepID=A0A2J7PPI3_9NEOP|nr:hypothetical protein B7P43_G17753 [Cryptotermes secundus]